MDRLRDRALSEFIDEIDDTPPLLELPGEGIVAGS